MGKKRIAYSNRYHLSDFSIKKIIIEDNTIIINLSLYDFNVSLICSRFIGINYIGQWDQGIVINTQMVLEHSLITDSLQKIRENNNKCYLNDANSNPDWIEDVWKVLIITLVDETNIEIACKEIIYEYDDK